MKKIFPALISILFRITALQAQEIAPEKKDSKDSVILEGTAHQIITSAANNAGYKVKFVGKRELNYTARAVFQKSDNIMYILGWLNLYHNFYFAYSAKNDTLIIDDYMVYSVDTMKKQSSFIEIHFDSARHGKVLAFENISPVIVLDSLLKINRRTLPINVKTSETVSGIIPLNFADSHGLSTVLTTHNWMLDNKTYPFMISPVPPEIEALKGSYNLDTSSTADSSYIIYTTQKRNNIRTVTFKHIRLQELFTIIRTNNNYNIDHTTFLRKQAYVSGHLPLELPLSAFASLILDKHGLCYYIDKKLIVFGETLHDLDDYYQGLKNE